MDAQALTGYIRQGIRYETHAEGIRLYLPFFFGQKQEEICLTWDKKGILSDGGRTLTELKNRLGDLSDYEKSIQRILKYNDQVTLEGGRNLVVRHFQTCICGEETSLDYMGGFNRLLRVMSLISVVDTVTVTEDGTVRLC